MFKIGDIKINSRTILAPMAGITDLAFRLINRKMGCQFAFVEMINARALTAQNKRTLKMLEHCPQDQPLGIQLIGADSEYMLKALDILAKYKFDLIDLNAACPMKKMVRRNEGAALLKNLPLLNKLLTVLVKNSSVPITVKLRSGWDNDSINACDAALLAQDAGVSAIFIHGRSARQKYNGQVDYSIIHAVKQAVKLPVIASGDNFSPLMVKKMFDRTGCDAVGIARGALGNPWIFSQIEAYLHDGTILPRPKVDEVVRVIKEHLKLCLKNYKPDIAIIQFRKLFVWYTRGFPGVKDLRYRAFKTKTKEQILEIIEEFHANCNTLANQ
jgi:tRNA-dihydrouridine synthase B